MAPFIPSVPLRPSLLRWGKVPTTAPCHSFLRNALSVLLPPKRLQALLCIPADLLPADRAVQLYFVFPVQSFEDDYSTVGKNCQGIFS